ncbi:hypothetical protein [Bacteroides sp. 224]|uniref:hypothetical protein n=1 Tax=Bacteroides sp. 224 TaxID=2302936 RepID=UPI0013D81A5E|nr:hypothetical protein [Bacteroides sp. 224]NDV65533.1 hypothetical protein [Bacteroides sp. 224]
MKTKIFTTIAFITFLVFTSCIFQKKGTDSNSFTTEPTEQICTTEEEVEVLYPNTTVTSIIRPGIDLKADQTYTDEFEYITFISDIDYPSFILKKDDETILVRNKTSHDIAMLELNQGDIVTVLWKFGFTDEDDDDYSLSEQAVEISKVKEGKVSLFKKIHPSLMYHYDEECGYNEWEIERINHQIEYYLTNSTKERVKSITNNPESAISYSIKDMKQGENTVHIVELFHEVDDCFETFQTIHLAENNEETYCMSIFEKDEKSNTLSEFKVKEAIISPRKISILNGITTLEMRKSDDDDDFQCIGLQLADSHVNTAMGTYLEIKRKGKYYLAIVEYEEKQFATIDQAIEASLENIFAHYYRENDKEHGEKVWEAFVVEGGLKRFIKTAKEYINDKFLDTPFNEIYG